MGGIWKPLNGEKLGCEVWKSLGWKYSFTRKLDIRGFGRMPQFQRVKYASGVMWVLTVDLTLLANPIIEENERWNVSHERLTGRCGAIFLKEICDYGSERTLLVCLIIWLTCWEEE
jgi:hypothetical protein